MTNTKNTIRKKTAGKFKRTIASVLAAVMMMTTAASFSAFADTQAVTTMNTTTAMSQAALYNGSPIIDDSYVCDNGITIPFKYSDGFFAADPTQFDNHLATMSDAMAEASTTYVNNGDWSDGAKTIKEVLGKCGFENVEESSSYKVKPTEDSIACAFGSKTIKTDNGNRTLISVTVRSASYVMEWCSNVTLGTSGEAKGFADSADKVVGYFNDYLAKHPELKDDLDSGKVTFWLSGFSRGGAVANLTAKRLIDAYQPNGTKVFAYTLETPQGGIASEEKSDRDYTCIHNIIDKNDIVPYVAPSQMGFKRYGVDYYVNDNVTDTDNVKYQISKVTGRADIGNYKPFDITGKKVNIIGLSIDDTNDHDTAGLIKRITDELCSVCSREQYVNSGLQDALRRFMKFINNGADLKAMYNDISITKLILSVVAAEYSDNLSAGSVVIKAAKTVGHLFSDAWNFVVHGKTPDPENYIPDPVGNMKKSAISAVQSYLKGNDKIMAKLANYQGGADQAIKDIGVVAKFVVDSGLDNLNDFATLGLNVEGIFNNHSTIQTMGYLRAADDWYKKGSYDRIKADEAANNWLANVKLVPDNFVSVF